MKAFLLIALLCCSLASQAAGLNKSPSDAELDRFIQRLEESGKMDAAFDRAVKRFTEKQQETKRKQQEAFLAKQREMSAKVSKPDLERDHVFGSNSAEITMIEFSDYECPFCKRFHGTPEELVKRSDGRVNLIWRHFPLDFHDPVATTEAEAAECVNKQAGNTAFWNFTNLVMARTQSNGKGLPATVEKEDPLLSLVAELKLDKAAFKQCMAEGAVKDRIKAHIKDGANAGVQGTPAVILYHNKTGKTDFISGAVPAADLEAAIKEMLAP